MVQSYPKKTDVRKVPLASDLCNIHAAIGESTFRAGENPSILFYMQLGADTYALPGLMRQANGWFTLDDVDRLQAENPCRVRFLRIDGGKRHY
jgi:hypothetical protein